MDLSDKIKAIKDHFNYNNNALGKIMGLTGTTVSDIVTGKIATLKSDSMEKLAKKLNISLDWLVLGEGPMIKSYSDDAELRGMLKILMIQVEDLKNKFTSDPSAK